MYKEKCYRELVHGHDCHCNIGLLMNCCFYELLLCLGGMIVQNISSMTKMELEFILDFFQNHTYRLKYMHTRSLIFG